MKVTPEEFSAACASADDLLIERAARGMVAMRHRRPDGELDFTRWTCLAPALKQKERDGARLVYGFLELALSRVRAPKATASPT